jgi:hypothetical protein
MLAEKFFLLLEMLKSRNYPDGSPRVVSSSPHIPVQLPDAKLTPFDRGRVNPARGSGRGRDHVSRR